MRIQLISKPDRQLTPRVQVLLNRGITPTDIPKYIESNMAESVNDAAAFGEDLLKQGAALLAGCISANKKAFIIVDSDVDGMTSSAILINYLYRVFPAWVNNNLSWGFHEGKQHGLNDFIDTLENMELDLVICPDSASNDIDEIERLHNRNIDVLILDHHEADSFSKYAVTINSQYNYPNDQLSGAGVVFQFCRFLDKMLGKSYADEGIDLCALGLQADMQDIRNIETKTLIFEGCKDKNISNPLMRSAIDKNEYSFSKADYKTSDDNGLLVSPMGLSFFLIPQMNAICRSGTMEEKALVFDSMLYHRAFEIVPSTKRGHKLGETEQKLTQALRTLTNVKNRQTRAETAALELFEEKIKNENLLDHKVILILNEPGVVDRNVAGLVANKIMAKYQRPCCVLTRVESEEGTTYQGSMRGYSRTGVTNFKDICTSSRGCLWSRGHQLAAGLCLNANKIDEFIEDTDKALAAISNEPIYYVDYIFSADHIDPDTVLSLAGMNDYLGTGIDRPLVYIEDVPLNALNLYKGNTLKISTPSNIDIMLFGTDEEFYDSIKNSNRKMNIVCRCNDNVWNWNHNAQLILEDWEWVETKEKSSDVIDVWGF